MKRWILLTLLSSILIIPGCSDNPTEVQDNLAAPTRLKVSMLAPLSTKLSWTDNSANETGFRIDRKVGSGAWVSDYYSVQADTANYIDTAVPYGDFVYYRVYAKGNGGYSGYAESGIHQMTPQPMNPTVVTVDNGRVQVSWTDNCLFESGFVIERKVNDGTFQVLANLVANTTYVMDSGLVTGTSYTYRIRTLVPGYDSDWSAEVAIAPGAGLFGSAGSFEVMTWNLEGFPKAGTQTITRLTQAIPALNADIIALQEIDSNSSFQQLVTGLPGWSGYRGSGSGYDINLAYLWRSDSVTNTQFYQIYEDESRVFPRAPLVMECRWQGFPVVVINNHLKCCGDGVIGSDEWDEERRRQDACLMLESYIDQHFPTANVVVVGDWNDELTDVQSKNVFWNFLTSQDYRFADLAIAQGPSSNWSYPTWPSHLDHILVTNELFDELDDANALVTTLKVHQYMNYSWSTYEQQVSDHVPVGMKVTPGDRHH